MYTVILISFGTISVGTEAGLTFKTSKPKVVIVNKDEYKSITKSLIKYIKSKNSIKLIITETILSCSSIGKSLFQYDENENKKNPSADRSKKRIEALMKSDQPFDESDNIVPVKKGNTRLT